MFRLGILQDVLLNLGSFCRSRKCQMVEMWRRQIVYAEKFEKSDESPAGVLVSRHFVNLPFHQTTKCNFIATGKELGFLVPMLYNFLQA